MPPGGPRTAQDAPAALLGCTEAQWHRTVVSAARALGWTTFHPRYSIGSEPGYPDVTFFHPAHGIVWAELKAERGRPTEAQRRWLDLIGAAGGRAFLWRPSDWEAAEAVLKGGDLRRVEVRPGPGGGASEGGG